MKESQRKYLYLKYEVVSVDMEEEKAVIEREDSRQTKTLHWCRKNLIKRLT
jgi:hypothetical protein